MIFLGDPVSYVHENDFLSINFVSTQNQNMDYKLQAWRKCRKAGKTWSMIINQLDFTGFFTYSFKSFISALSAVQFTPTHIWSKVNKSCNSGAQINLTQKTWIQRTCNQMPNRPINQVIEKSMHWKNIYLTHVTRRNSQIIRKW